MVNFIAQERSLQTIEFQYFRPHVKLSMLERALIRRIGLISLEAGVMPSHLSPGSSPSASDDLDLLPWLALSRDPNV